MPRRNTIKVGKDTCVFCHTDDSHALLGTLVEKSNMKMHTNCIFTASGLSQETDTEGATVEHVDGFLVTSIQRELRRGRNLRCTLCRNHGACVGCVVSSCQASFHLPCLIKSCGVTIYKDTFPSYCRRHVPKQDLETPMKNCKEPPICCICLFSLLPDSDELDALVSNTKQIRRRRTTLMKQSENSQTPIIKRPRRSCVTSSTPKRIMVSDGMSSVKRKLLFERSSWELASSSPEHEDGTPLTLGQKRLCINTDKLPPTFHDLPQWLVQYFSKLSFETQVPAFETWRHNTIYGFCCPLSWMHRDCIAGFAASAALHFLKCPYCASKETFFRSIIDAGIWIPDRDAAWELEPGAYPDAQPVDGQEADDSISVSESSSSITYSTTNKQNDDWRDHSSNSSSNQQEQNTMLSLVWNNGHFTDRGSRPRRRTHLPPPAQPKRTSRRRTCIGQYGHESGTNFLDSRLRQVTLGPYLSSVHNKHL